MMPPVVKSFPAAKVIPNETTTEKTNNSHVKSSSVSHHQRAIRTLLKSLLIPCIPLLFYINVSFLFTSALSHYVFFAIFPSELV